MAHWGMLVLGWAMVITSLLCKFDGLPQQIRVNFRTRTAPVVLQRYLFWGGVSYALQVAYCAWKQDWLMMIAQIPGVILIAVILFQMRRYN
jgi:hypothetical protein